MIKNHLKIKFYKNGVSNKLDLSYSFFFKLQIIACFQFALMNKLS